MRRFSRFLLGTLLPLSVQSFAQDAPHSRSFHPIRSHAAARTTVASLAEDEYDVKYVKLDVNVNNVNTRISGNVTTVAQVTATTMPAYVFELQNTMRIDSVLVNGAICSLTTTGDVRTATLPAALSAGATFTARVYYNGTPTSGTSFGGPTGMNTISSPSWGNRATFTLSESYKASEWWPCKQSLKDKIDSTDIWLTVPDTLKAGSNGVLQAVTAVDSTHDRYEWKERYPIDYYLISLSVANYIDYSYYMHFSGSTDSMLVQNYVYNNSGTLPRFKSVIDSTGMMIDFFSQLYGRYPFWREKYGHCMAPLSGGMEHQTMTTLGFFEGGLVAHELGHQWFGDNVTCATWADIFINEGFASYSEDLFIDRFRNHTAMITDMRSKQSDVKSAPDGAIFVDDTTNEARIFDSRLSYNKGASFLHMLRFVINNDSTFFHTFSGIQAAKTGNTATIDDYKAVCQSVAGARPNGMNLDTFFNEWTYGEGYPVYTLKWNQIDSEVYIKLDQATTMASSVPLFYTPFEIKLRSAAGDSTFRFFNNMPVQYFHITWPKAMTGVTFDPNYWLVYDMASIGRDFTLGSIALAGRELHISPNPATDYWTIDNLPENTRLTLSDLSGRVLVNVQAGGAIKLSAADLAPGMYLLRAEAGGTTATFKLVKSN